MIGSNYKDIKIPLRGTLGPSKSSQGGADLESESSSLQEKMWLQNPGWWRKPLSCLAQSGSIVTGPRESTPWPPEELWLTGGHTGGRGRLLPGRAACELGFAGVRAGRASVDSPLGCGQAEINGCSY